MGLSVWVRKSLCPYLAPMYQPSRRRWPSVPLAQLKSSNSLPISDWRTTRTQLAPIELFRNKPMSRVQKEQLNLTPSSLPLERSFGRHRCSIHQDRDAHQGRKSIIGTVQVDDRSVRAMTLARSDSRDRSVQRG